MPEDYKFTQQSGAGFKVNTADKADALEDTNEVRQILIDLGTLLGHSKKDGSYPKDRTVGGTLLVLFHIEEDANPKLGGELAAGAHSIGFTVQTITSTAGTATIDWGNSNKARITLSENTVLAFTNPANSGNYMLIIIQPAGANAYTTTFPAGIYWANGAKISVPTTGGNVCIVSFVFDKEDSNKWYCQGTEIFAIDD